MTGDVIAHRGSAGGSAGTVGVTYAASVAAWCAVKLLMGRKASLSWDLSSGSIIVSVACESASEVDDLVLRLMPHGNVYIQIKHGLRAGKGLVSAVSQLVRQYRRPGFRRAEDRLVIATDYSSSATIRVEMNAVLRRCHDLPRGASLEREVALSAASLRALNTLKGAIDVAWVAEGGGRAPNEDELREFLGCMHISVLDPLSGNERQSSIEALSSVVKESDGAAAWRVLNQICLNAAELRQPFDRPALWRRLRREGIATTARWMLLGESANDVKSIVQCLTDRALNRLRVLRKYSREKYVARQELDIQFGKYIDSSSKVMLVSGESGKGKTNWCAFQCERNSDYFAVFISCEELDVKDNGVFKSIARLLGPHLKSAYGELVCQVELDEWLFQEEFLVFLDGLDRAPVSFLEGLRGWLEYSLSDLERSAAKLVVSSRPEVLVGALDLLDSTELVFKSSVGSSRVLIGDFDKEEALEAAIKLGDSGLCIYRNPGMMAFSSKLKSQVSLARLHQVEIVTRYMERRIKEIQLESGLLLERLNDYVFAVGQMLVRSADGVLSRKDLRELRSMDIQSYEAVRRSNLIVECGGYARVEPDELSEYIQGTRIDILTSIAAVENLIRFPLKIGALRSALEVQARIDRDGTLRYLDALIDNLEARSYYPVIVLVCRVMDLFKEWGDLEPFARKLARSWTEQNYFLLPEGETGLLRTLRDSRWTTMQSLSLLWELSYNESGYDWREKHWLTPDYAPNFHVTRWRRAVLDALESAGVEGLAFLASQLDSRESLRETNEADHGDLVSGLFYIISRDRVEVALDVLLQFGTNECYSMFIIIAGRHQSAVARYLAHHAPLGRIPPAVVSKSVNAIFRSGNLGEEVVASVRSLSELSGSLSWGRECLRVLSLSGDFRSARKLAEHPDLSFDDVYGCRVYEGAEYLDLVEIVFNRATVDDWKFSVPALVEGEISASQCDALIGKVLSYIQKESSLISVVADFVEQMIHAALHLDVFPERLISLADLVMGCGDKRAVNCMVYACTGHVKDSELSVSGVDARRRMVSSLASVRLCESSVLLFANNLAERHSYSSHAISILADLLPKYPDIGILSYLESRDCFPGVRESLSKVKSSSPVE